MAFLKHLLPAWKKGIEDKRKANAAILSAFDTELTEAERDAIDSKVLMSLDTATAEWLDAYGKLFGVIRKDDEADNVYRQRIVNYVLLKRGTIPAIIEAIRDFLQDYVSHVEVYEPYNNIFFLNRSKLNGPDHFLGEYYTFAVIDIKFARNFPIEIMDIINKFKPAGVKVILTYRPNGANPNATVVELPLASSEILEPNTRLRIMNGMNDRVRGHLNLGERTKDGANSDIFILNRSRLNSLDVLTGSYTVGNPVYNLASFSTEDQMFTTNTAVPDVRLLTEEVSEDFYSRTRQADDQYASHTISGNETSYLHFTLDVATYCYINFNNYLREIEPSGIYAKETYLSLIGDPSLHYYMKAVTPISSPSNYTIQLLNLTSGMWDDMDAGAVKYSVIGGKLSLSNFSDYLAESGCVFVRIKVDPNSAAASYDLHVHFFELGFKKEIAIRPTIIVPDLEVIQTKSTAYGMGYVFDGGTFTQTVYNKNVDGGSF